MPHFGASKLRYFVAIKNQVTSRFGASFLRYFVARQDQPMLFFNFPHFQGVNIFLAKKLQKKFGGLRKRYYLCKKLVAH
jgi:hypothetical protein